MGTVNFLFFPVAFDLTQRVTERDSYIPEEIPKHSSDVFTGVDDPIYIIFLLDRLRR
jgi:hypothetical protein